MAGIARIDSAADQNITTRNTGQKMTLGTVALSTGTDVDTGTASTIKALTAGNYLVMAAADVSVGATSNTTYVGIAKGGSYSSGLLAYSYKKCDSPKLKCANIVALAANDALTMMGRYDNSSSQTTTYIPGIEEQHGTTTYLSAVKLSGDVAKLIKSSGTQNISATTDTVVTGSSDATVTTGSTFTVSGNKITANVATPVLVVWSVGWSAGSAIFHICGVRLNGGNWISYDSNSDLNGSPTTTPKLNGAFALKMAAGDYLELMAYREASGTTQTVTGTTSLGQETYLCVAAVTDMIRLDQSSDQSITPDTSSTGIINYLLDSADTQVAGSTFSDNGDGTVSIENDAIVLAMFETDYSAGASGSGKDKFSAIDARTPPLMTTWDWTDPSSYPRAVSDDVQSTDTPILHSLVPMQMSAGWKVGLWTWSWAGSSTISASNANFATAMSLVRLDAGGASTQTVSPSGIASGAAFGTPTIVPGTAHIAPSGIASATAFGSAKTKIWVTPSGVASAAAVGSPTVKAVLRVIATGIASAEAFGTPTVTLGPATISPAGIDSGEQFGIPTVTGGANQIIASGIPSAETFGTPTVTTGAVSISPTGIASESAVGTPTVRLYRDIDVRIGLADDGQWSVGVADAEAWVAGRADASAWAPGTRDPEQWTVGQVDA